MVIETNKLKAYKDVPRNLAQQRISDLDIPVIRDLDVADYFKFIDYALLSFPTSERLIEKKLSLLRSVYDGNPDIRFASVCVFPNHLQKARDYLKNTKTQISAVTGNFPTGQGAQRIKLMETRYAIDEGASEIDYIYNIGNLIDEEYQLVFDELSALKEVCGNTTLKVIIESGSLSTLKSIRIATEIAIAAGADFVKTSTGKNDEGAELEDVYTIMKTIKTVFESNGKRTGVKVSGGIQNKKNARSFMELQSAVLGKDWLNPKEFRLGAGAFAEKLLAKYVN